MSIFGDLLNKANNTEIFQYSENGYYRRYETAPYAVDGNWPVERTNDKRALGPVKINVLKSGWKKLPKTIFVDKLQKFIKEKDDDIVIMYTTDNKYSMLVGLYSTKFVQDKDHLERYTLLSTNRYEEIVDAKLKRKFPNLYQSAEIRTLSDYQGNGMAESIYQSLLYSGFQLISDYTQYDGARYLWRRLSQDRKLNMYVYDEINDKIVAEGHKINNVEYDKLDKEWTRDFFGKEKNMLFIVEKGE